MAEDEDYYEDDFEDDEASSAPTTPLPPSPAHGAAVGADAESPTRPGYSRSPSMQFPWTLVTLDDLDLGDKLAAGAMGAVYAGYYRGRPVAIKTLHDVSRNALSAVEQELLVHAALKGPRTVELIAANLVPPKCCIVMERCECSLFEKLHRRADDMSRRQWLGIAIQVAEGMNFLHTRRPPVVHRDLKSHNVLLDPRGDAKLCDFGLVNTKEVRAAAPPRRRSAHAWPHAARSDRAPGMTLTVALVRSRRARAGDRGHPQLHGARALPLEAVWQRRRRLRLRRAAQ